MNLKNEGNIKQSNIEYHPILHSKGVITETIDKIKDSVQYQNSKDEVISSQNKKAFGLFNKHFSIDSLKILDSYFEFILKLFRKTTDYKDLVEDELRDFFYFILKESHTIKIITEINLQLNNYILYNCDNLKIESKSDNLKTSIIYEITDKKDYSSTYDEKKDPLKIME